MTEPEMPVSFCCQPHWSGNLWPCVSTRLLPHCQDL